MGTGPMRFGEDNNSGPDDTVLRSQNSFQATLDVLNEATANDTAGGGLTVTGGPFGVKATAGPDTELPEIGVHGIALDPPNVSTGIGVKGEGSTGVFGRGGVGNGVRGRSLESDGVRGASLSHDASGVYGLNGQGGWGVVGRTYGLSIDRAAVMGQSFADTDLPSSGANGTAAGVEGYSETGWGGIFRTGQIGTDVPWASSGGLLVVGRIVKEEGEYSEALPHPDGTRRLMYAPLSPESWYEDVGRAELVEGRAEVELDADFAAVVAIDDDSYHVFLTPEGDTGGLYVSGRSARAFTVREQHDGTSSATFSYRVLTKNKHRQPPRLARFEESEELTKPPQAPSLLPEDRSDSLA